MRPISCAIENRNGLARDHERAGTNYHVRNWRNPPVLLDGFDFAGLSGPLIPRHPLDRVPSWLGQLIADARACRGERCGMR